MKSINESILAWSASRAASSWSSFNDDGLGKKTRIATRFATPSVFPISSDAFPGSNMTGVPTFMERWGIWASILGGWMFFASIMSKGFGPVPPTAASKTRVHSLVPSLIRLLTNDVDGSISRFLLFFSAGTIFPSLISICRLARGTETVSEKRLQISLSSRSRTISLVTLSTTGVWIVPLYDATHAKDSLSSSECGSSRRCLLDRGGAMVHVGGRSKIVYLYQVLSAKRLRRWILTIYLTVSSSTSCRWDDGWNSSLFGARLSSASHHRHHCIACPSWKNGMTFDNCQWLYVRSDDCWVANRESQPLLML